MKRKLYCPQWQYLLYLHLRKCIAYNICTYVNGETMNSLIINYFAGKQADNTKQRYYPHMVWVRVFPVINKCY